MQVTAETHTPDDYAPAAAPTAIPKQPAGQQHSGNSTPPGWPQPYQPQFVARAGAAARVPEQASAAERKEPEVAESAEAHEEPAAAPHPSDLDEKSQASESAGQNEESGASVTAGYDEERVTSEPASIDAPAMSSPEAPAKPSQEPSAEPSSGASAESSSEAAVEQGPPGSAESSSPEPAESSAEPSASAASEAPRQRDVGSEPQEPLSVLPFLRALSELSGSDLHCKVGAAPRIRIDGRLRRVRARDLIPADTDHMLSEVIRADLVEDFRKNNEADFGFSLAGVGRFRVNAYRARGSVGLVFRRVAVGAIPLTELGVPEVIASLALEPRGLVLVTGPTGSGKTTTLAGMVDHINTTKEVHIVTIEDPIEVLHHDKASIINQREVGLDTKNFAVALRAAMRQDPDVVLVGEMRDAETVGAALSASETGHFVMSTLHTTDAAETITRVIDFFPPHEQKQVRLSLSAALKGIVCQRLVPRSDGRGRVVVMEICVNNGRIADAIADPEKTGMITQLIKEGGFYGMQSFDQHLLALYRDRVISLDDALHASSNPHDLQVELRAQGLL